MTEILKLIESIKVILKEKRYSCYTILSSETSMIMLFINMS